MLNLTLGCFCLLIPKDSGQAIPRVVESCIRYINLYGEVVLCFLVVFFHISQVLYFVYLNICFNFLDELDLLYKPTVFCVTSESI